MLLHVSEDKIRYSPEPENPSEYTEKLNASYSKFARLYDRSVKFLPLWKKWIQSVVPHIAGKRVLEASFGTGYLLTKYAGKYDCFGIDYNRDMVAIAERNLEKKGLKAKLQQANVEALPYPDCHFDTIVNTMAFSGYPNGQKAMGEFYRVLKPGGQLLIVDFDYPANRNRFGYCLTKLMEKGGDTIRHLPDLLAQFGFEFTETEVGGFGSVHLYVARK